MPYVLFYQNIDCINNNNTNNNSNSSINNNDEMITLYFKTINGKEIYLDVNSNDLFGNIIQILANKYNNNYYDYMKSNYFIITLEGKQYLDINKTVKENNLSNFSYIIIG